MMQFTPSPPLSLSLAMQCNALLKILANISSWCVGCLQRFRVIVQSTICNIPLIIPT